MIEGRCDRVSCKRWQQRAEDAEDSVRLLMHAARRVNSVKKAAQLFPALRFLRQVVETIDGRRLVDNERLRP